MTGFFAPAHAAFAIVALAQAPAAQTPAAPPVTEIVMTFTAADGTPLEAKLTVPADATGPVPVVFHLHGAGPRNYDHALQYRDAAGQLRVYRYYDFYAHELARRGLAFFRMSKRGCTMEPSGKPVVDRAVFSRATPTVLLDDYTKALDALRARKEIDATRIVVSGASEGTRLGPELALRSPDGIVGIALSGYAADNTRDTVVWQNSVGPWRNVQKLIPAAVDGALTKEVYDAAAAKDATIAARLPFAALDADSNNTLLKLDVPIAIFHGDLDGTTRVEGAREPDRRRFWIFSSLPSTSFVARDGLGPAFGNQQPGFGASQRHAVAHEALGQIDPIDDLGKFAGQYDGLDLFRTIVGSAPVGTFVAVPGTLTGGRMHE